MKTLILILLSFATFAQKDTTIASKKVVVINGTYLVEYTTTNITYEPLDTQFLSKVEDIEDQKLRRIKENENAEAERKEYVKMLKEAIKKGYKPKSDNIKDDEINKRILNKINKEKL